MPWWGSYPAAPTTPKFEEFVLSNHAQSVQQEQGVAVVMYGKPDCRQCDMTVKVLRREGVVFEKVDVTTDPDALAFVTDLGYQAAPVVYVSTPEGDKHWSGFQPALLKNEITHRADTA